MGYKARVITAFKATFFLQKFKIQNEDGDKLHLCEACLVQISSASELLRGQDVVSPGVEVERLVVLGLAHEFGTELV